VGICGRRCARLEAYEAAKAWRRTIKFSKVGGVRCVLYTATLVSTFENRVPALHASIECRRCTASTMRRLACTVINNVCAYVTFSISFFACQLHMS